MIEGEKDLVFNSRSLAEKKLRAGVCLPSKSPKLFGPISGTTINFISLQRRGSKPSNLAILLVSFTLQICLKIIFSKQVDWSLTTGFWDTKTSRDFRGTGPRREKGIHLQKREKLR